MQYTHIFFDLDGTLINSAPGITHSAQYALRKMGIEPPPAEQLTCFIGPPLADSFSKFFGFSPEQSQAAVAYYREYYRERGILECGLYNGIAELLQALRKCGVMCALATCKPHLFATQILKNLGIDPYFAVIAGPELDGTRGTKQEVIAHAAEQLALNDLSCAVMVGDRDNDILGAKHHGMNSVGALWGFGTREELTAAGATYLSTSPRHLVQLLGSAE